ncbi:hypothetical protein Btru_030014 [Bulinus truncatus]|nr:hypothetical protein Btru_030014 [Bulinus truncatus]
MQEQGGRNNDTAVTTGITATVSSSYYFTYVQHSVDWGERGHVLLSTSYEDVMNLTTDPPPQPVRLLTAFYPICDRTVTTVQSDIHSNKSRRTAHDAESDFGALVYIVVVLVFYSAGVMVMIVRYLKTEKKELEEEAALENFFKYMPDKKQEQEHRVNRVAIHAFHTLTSISYDEEELDERDLTLTEDAPVEPQTFQTSREVRHATCAETAVK